MNRRSFITSSSSCAAYMAGMAQFAPTMLQAVLTGQQEKREVVKKEKWGRIEKIHDGAWALISTPFGTRDYKTVCNGGILAGDNGVLAIESFMTPAGATWLGQMAKELTGRWPTDVVSTHYHGDHTGGHKGYFVDQHQPKIWLTDATKKAAEKSFAARKMKGNEFQNVKKIDAQSGAQIDLGNRQINLKPRSGHTASDVTIELVEPKIVFSGDLFFNRMFPNYTDATPGRLMKYASEIKKANDTIFVPGHGPVANDEAIDKYIDFLGWVEEWAKNSIDRKETVDTATKNFKLDEKHKAWFVWSPQNAKNAWLAWQRQLDSES